jgi:hypothetical protein
VVEDGVDNAGAVEADHDRQTPRHGRRLEPADLLQAENEQLDIDPSSLRGIVDVNGLSRTPKPMKVERYGFRLAAAM